MNLAMTIIVAVIGSFLFHKMKIPAGALIGAIIFSAGFNILTGIGEFPDIMKTGVQAIAGGFIGQRVTRKDVAELKNTIGGGVLMFFCMIIYTLVVGTILSSVSHLDFATALVATMPAGLSDTAIISGDLGADSTQTTVLQLVRTLFCILVLPQAAYKVCTRVEKFKEPEAGEPANELRLGYKSPEIRTVKNAFITVALAEGAGILGKLSGIPAGAMTFAVLAISAQNIKTDRAYLPKKLKLIAQCMTGIIVGIKVTMQDVQNLRFLLGPVFIMLISLVICNYVCGFLIYKICKLDIATCLFGSIPAGVSDMALIATDMGGDAPKVGVLQLVRYIGILSVMPTIIKLIT